MGIRDEAEVWPRLEADCEAASGVGHLHKAQDGQGPELKFERWIALATVLLLVLFHLFTTHSMPLHKQIFREGSTIFIDPGGTEADTHIDRLLTHRALEACPSFDGPCWQSVLEVADRHHPPLTQLSAALWNFGVGIGVFETLWLNLFWLGLMLFATHYIGRQLAGPAAGWVALFMMAAAPVFLGPTRLLHQDAPMSALILTFGALLLHLYVLKKARWMLIWGPLAALMAALALLTKWEAVLAVVNVAVGAFLYGCIQRRYRWRSIGVGFFSVAFLAVIWAYLGWIPSSSFAERPSLRFLAGPEAAGELWQTLSSHIQQVEPEGGISESQAPDSLIHRIQFYIMAIPTTAVGLLLSLATLLGLGGLVRSPYWLQTLALTLPWAAGGFLSLIMMVTTFADDRFIHFFMAPIFIASAVGWAQIRSRWVLVGIGMTAFVQVWDLSIKPSLLPYRPAITLPKAGFYEPEARQLALRPDTPFGHGTWVRPQRRYPSDLDGVLKAIEHIEEAGYERLSLAMTCEGLCSEYRLWQMGALMKPAHKGPAIYPSVHALDGRANDYESRCQSRLGYEWQQLYGPGAVVIFDGIEGENLGEVDWSRATCGQIRNPHAMGYQPIFIETLEVASGTISLLTLEALPEFPVSLPAEPVGEGQGQRSQ